MIVNKKDKNGSKKLKVLDMSSKAKRMDQFKFEMKEGKQMSNSMLDSKSSTYEDLNRLGNENKKKVETSDNKPLKTNFGISNNDLQVKNRKSQNITQLMKDCLEKG